MMRRSGERRHNRQCVRASVTPSSSLYYQQNTTLLTANTSSTLQLLVLSSRHCTHCDDDDDDHALQFTNHQLVMKVLCTGELVLQLKNASIAFDTSGPPPINFPVMQAMST